MSFHLSLSSFSPQSKKKGLNVDEKRKRVLDFFYEKQDFFNMKDLEKMVSKEKGVGKRLHLPFVIFEREDEKLKIFSFFFLFLFFFLSFSQTQSFTDRQGYCAESRGRWDG